MHPVCFLISAQLFRQKQFKKGQHKPQIFCKGQLLEGTAGREHGVDSAAGNKYRVYFRTEQYLFRVLCVQIQILAEGGSGRR